MPPGRSLERDIHLLEDLSERLTRISGSQMVCLPLTDDAGQSDGGSTDHSRPMRPHKAFATPSDSYLVFILDSQTYET